jgi:hypothetical protein
MTAGNAPHIFAHVREAQETINETINETFIANRAAVSHGGQDAPNIPSLDGTHRYCGH